MAAKKGKLIRLKSGKRAIVSYVNGSTKKTKTLKVPNKNGKWTEIKTVTTYNMSRTKAGARRKRRG